jgi:hypothetical protein
VPSCCTAAAPVAFKPTTTTYNLYLAARVSSGSGDMSLLASTLAEMEKHGAAPTPWTFNPHAWLAFKQNSWQLADVRRASAPSCAPCLAPRARPV